MSRNLADEGWREELTGSAFGDLIGPHFAKEINGVARYGFLVEEKHLNRIGGLHGGMTAACLDMALARTVAKTLNMPNIATVHLGIEFVDSARAGDFAEIAVEIVRATKSVVFCRGTLLVGEKVVAIANGVWKILGPSRQETRNG